MEEKKEKEQILPKGFLPEDVFKEKYETCYKQQNPEFYLDEVSAENREKYTDAEILTGRNLNGDFNCFNNFGTRNRGKTYNTTKGKFINEFKKFVDKKIADGNAEEIFERMWKSSKNGSFNHLKYLFDRIAGKEEENINLKSEENITFTFMPPKKSIERKNENKEK